MQYNVNEAHNSKVLVYIHITAMHYLTKHISANYYFYKNIEQRIFSLENSKHLPTINPPMYYDFLIFI
jgi:hypothetical protein